MSASLTNGGTGLKAFRLLDVPLAVRLRAAKRLARTNNTPDDNTPATDRLLAAVLDVRTHSVAEKDAIQKAAERPSGKVYYVSMEAWEKVMG